MEISSNILRIDDLRGALQTAKSRGQVADTVEFLKLYEQPSRYFRTKYVFQLGSNTKKKLDGRYRSRFHTGYTATTDEHGYFFRAVFEVDPDAVVFVTRTFQYSGVQDFNFQTSNNYVEALPAIDEYPYRIGIDRVGKKANRLSLYSTWKELAGTAYAPRK